MLLLLVIVLSVCLCVVRCFVFAVFWGCFDYVFGCVDRGLCCFGVVFFVGVCLFGVHCCCLCLLCCC